MKNNLYAGKISYYHTNHQVKKQNTIYPEGVNTGQRTAQHIHPSLLIGQEHSRFAVYALCVVLTSYTGHITLT